MIVDEEDIDMLISDDTKMYLLKGYIERSEDIKKTRRA